MRNYVRAAEAEQQAQQLVAGPRAAVLLGAGNNGENVPSY